MLEIVSGAFRFVARIEEEAAPETVATFRRLLPLESRHRRALERRGVLDPVRRARRRVRAGECTRYAAPGQILFYPGGVSETEILFPYGPTAFASKAGALAGNHFATVLEGVAGLGQLGQDAVGRRAGNPLRGELESAAQSPNGLNGFGLVETITLFVSR